MPDRTKQPEINKIERIDLIQPQKIRLNNNIPLYGINAGEQDLIKIELIFPAGKWYQDMPLTATMTNLMLLEGTTNYSATKIVEIFDYYGAYVELLPKEDDASVSLYSLNKHLKNTLPLLADIIKNSVFPEKEFQVLKQNQRQEFIVNNEKVDYLARVHFNTLLFGEKHPYGRMKELKDYDNLLRTLLMEFYKKYYLLNYCTIIAAGKIDEEIIFLINENFGKDKLDDSDILEKYQVSDFPQTDKKFILKDNAVQSAIRVGKILFNKIHPDYMGMQVLNTILGGYFGSRLMSNIREQKGYTYGIGSAIISFKNAGLFFITTQTGIEYTKNTINEIYYELKRLREELIPIDELETVRNYMLGVLLRSADGPFGQAELFKELLKYNLNYDYYIKFIDVIKNITPEKLQELANKYLTQETMSEVIVGKM